VLRLQIKSQSPERTVLQIDGRLSGQEVQFLQREGERLLHESAHLVLDLHGTRFVDRAGVELLRHWLGQGIALEGASAFVRMQLQQGDDLSG